MWRTHLLPGGPNRRAALPVVLKALALLPQLRARGPAGEALDVDGDATTRWNDLVRAANLPRVRRAGGRYGQRK
eukprot:2789857-Amphidinium_carterae.1